MYGDLDFHTIGILIAFSGTALSSIKSMVIEGASKHNVLGSILFISVFGMLESIGLAFATDRFWASFHFLRHSSVERWSLLLGFGLIGFISLMSTFLTYRYIGAVAAGVSSNVKSAILVGISIFVFHTPVTCWNGIGMGLTLLGQVLYTGYSFEERERAAALEVKRAADLELGTSQRRILRSSEIPHDE